MGVFQNNLLAGAVAATAGDGAFYSHQIEQSARFDADSTASNSSRLTQTLSTVDSSTCLLYTSPSPRDRG